MSKDNHMGAQEGQDPRPVLLQIDGTGEPGHVMSLSLENRTNATCEIGLDGQWLFRLQPSDLAGLERVTKATITATTRQGKQAEEEIWLDVTTGEIFGYDPAEDAAPIQAGHVTLTEALADDVSNDPDPLTPYSVRMFDFRLAPFDALSVVVADRDALAGLSALIIHGDETHLLFQSLFEATGRREEIGDRIYDIYTWGEVDIVVDCEIRVVS